MIKYQYQFIFTDGNNDVITSMAIDSNLSIDVNELGDDIANALSKQLNVVVTSAVSGVITKNIRRDVTIVFEHNGEEVHRVTRAVADSSEAAVLGRKICREIERDLHITDVSYGYIG